jgi:hypothetical protein
MAIHFTTKLFPKKASLKEKSGLPWGFVFQPLVPPYKDTTSSNSSPFTAQQLPLSKVARCQTCYAYINPFVKFTDKKWRCPLCHQSNSLKGSLRYASSATRSQLPELKLAYIEYTLDEESEEKEDLELTSEDLLIVIAVVDITTVQFIQQEIVKALSQLLDVLPPTCLFGLVAYGAEMSIYDLRSPTPHVRHVLIPPQSPSSSAQFSRATSGSLSETSLFVPSLEDVAPLPQFLVPIANYRSNVLRAIESLPLLTSHQQETPQKRGLGYTVYSLIDYLSNYEESLNVHLLLFMSGPCNYGMGATVTLASPPSKRGVAHTFESVLRDLNAELSELHKTTPESNDNSSPSDTTTLPTDVASTQPPIQDIAIQPQTDCYREWALRAAEAGIAIDLFAFVALDKNDDSSLGLATTKFLSSLTGGSVRLYTPETVTLLAQDVVKLLSVAQAYRGVLRLRTSGAFRVKTAYGPLRADAAQPDLFHLTHCNSYTTLCFDFEHVHSRGLVTDDPQEIPTLQIAFAFVFLAPYASDAPSSFRGRMRLYRRVIVHTLQVGVAYRPPDLYESAHLDSVVALLVHKVLRASLDEGIREGCALLRDWLIIFLLKYNQMIGSKANELDITLNRYPNLRDLPTLVFSFLKHPLLRPLPQHSADYWIFLQCLYTTSLSPSLLRVALYPTLFALREGPREGDGSEAHSPFLVHPWFSPLTLSLRVVRAANAPLFFLDTLHTLHLFQVNFTSQSSSPTTTSSTSEGHVVPTFNPANVAEYTDLFTRSGLSSPPLSSLPVASLSSNSTASLASSSTTTVPTSTPAHSVSSTFVDLSTVPIDEESKVMKLIRHIQRIRPVTPPLVIHPPFEDPRGNVRLAGTTTALNELLLEEENTAGESLAQWLTALRSHLFHFYTHSE